jgi:hypothetical protein
MSKSRTHNDFFLMPSQIVPERRGPITQLEALPRIKATLPVSLGIDSSAKEIVDCHSEKPQRHEAEYERVTQSISGSICTAVKIGRRCASQGPEADLYRHSNSAFRSGGVIV